VIKILIVDDSALMRRVLGEIFKAQGDFEVAFARDGREALDQLHAFRPDVVTLDVQMPHMDGLSCLDRIMLERPCPVVMVSALTAHGADVTLEAMQLGAVDFITKPTGTVSLAVDDLTPVLIEKIRTASKARLRRSLRLSERLRLLAMASPNPRPASPPQPSPQPSPPPQLAAPLLAEGTGPADGVVLVGTSTGGPPALDILLSGLPADFPWPILVAQHMPAAFTASLARRLDKLCALTVIEVTRTQALVPGFVYIGRGDADIVVAARPGGPVVMAAPASAAHRWHPSVDRLVTTAIEHLGAPRLIGVLMTGMGNDGAAAMTRLRAQGGRTIAESEESAVVWGMPGELVKAGGADTILSLNDIPRQLCSWAA
jgi:two-component system chemotaxis response regulator CheB